MKTAIVVVWFGKLPSYFPMWVRSLKGIKNFDFLLFTDQNISNVFNSYNLRIINYSFESFKNLISAKVSLELNFSNAYKLCDFRPAFGEILHEYLTGYNFWGNCDLDMMFGDLDNFITPEVLNKYKKVLNRGHLTLYKNDKNINELYCKSNKLDYKRIFKSPDYCLFDEWHGIHQIFKEYNIAQYHREIIADINANSASFICTNIENYRQQIFVWNKGTIKQHYLSNDKLLSKPLAYIHFQKRIMNINNGSVFNSPSVILSSYGFFPFEGDVTLDVIKEYNRKNYGHYFKRQYTRFVKKLPLTTSNSIKFNKRFR